MALNTVQIWTYVVASGIDYEISFPQFGFTTISIKATGGEVLVLGSGIANGVPSEYITLTDGQSITIDGGNGNIIEYLSISATTGDANIIAR